MYSLQRILGAQTKYGFSFILTVDRDYSVPARPFLRWGGGGGGGGIIPLGHLEADLP